MKQLFFLLFFLNLVYFFWWFTAGENKMTANQVAPLYKDSQLEELKPVSKNELVHMVSSQALSDEQIEKRDVDSLGACFLLGDFEDENEAKVLSNGLKGLVKDVLVVPMEPYEEYWVISPSEGDWNQSLLKVEQLKEKGVKDLWLVPSGPYKGVISLGLFATQNSTEKRVKELAEKQVKTDVISREKYRYGVKLVTEGDVKPIQNYLNSTRPDELNRLRKIAC
ncbi:MAG: hypothetical protein CL866_06730 [Cycloclasticus sp.]|nr:hypothetical protein [Cycloclasticus sp.]MBG96548.1 hypothetical protein [Cycloclasticus sp.]HAI96166.1 hypothetical protein [Methylococcaceae bacterium]|tara:strand:+ start:1847 stop:2515 length:669 start_codon:yes stop_codon:yes gene_type:complete